MNERKPTKTSNQALLPIDSLREEAPRLEFVEEKNDVEYFSIKSKTVLNRCSSESMPFTWTINPYRGCEFGCKYCFARYTHEYLGMAEVQDFERKIYMKLNAPEILAKDLMKANAEGKLIAIGTATDPYQPSERRVQVTRKLLEVFSSCQGLNLSITTKSALVKRDIDLLKAVNERNRLRINFSLITLDTRLLRALEPRAPTPQKRLDAMKALSEAGLEVGLFLAPILPGMTDDRSTLESVIKAAIGAGASYVASDVVNLRSAARKQFFPFLAENFPPLLPLYKRMFNSSAYVSNEYGTRLQNLVDEIWQKYRSSFKPPRTAPAKRRTKPRQMNLTFDS
jgi:DNA repair photolyase